MEPLMTTVIYDIYYFIIHTSSFGRRFNLIRQKYISYYLIIHSDFNCNRLPNVIDLFSLLLHTDGDL
jgi:hypothetical protein